MKTEGFLEYMTHEPLYELDDVLFLYKRHLHVELCKFRLPVRPQIFVPETAHNLKVLFHSRNHKYLLVELGRLGKGIELSRVHPAWYKIITGPFRGASCEHWGLYFEKALAGKIPPHGLADIMPELKVLEHHRTPKINVAIFQAYVFRHLLFLV